MRHDHLSVVLDLDISSNEFLVFDQNTAEFIDKAKLRDTMQIRS
mgnify:FL=1